MDKEEAEVVRALKFVKVGIDYRAEVVSGFLTDTSVAMLLAEMQRRGIRFSSRMGRSEMVDRATILTEDQVAELVTWAMCEMAGGAGEGKCDPERCVCGAEGRVVANRMYSEGYKVHIVRDSLS